MKKQLVNVLFGVAFLVSIFGCASVLSSLLQGGTIVGDDYQPKRIIVSYRAEGVVPENTKYFLIETKEGEEAIWEKVTDGRSAICTAYRQTEQGDHFSCWVPGQNGFEYIIPKDRSKEAKRFIYPSGKYKALRGSMAVVPLKDFSPATRLIPE